MVQEAINKFLTGQKPFNLQWRPSSRLYSGVARQWWNTLLILALGEGAEAGQYL